MATFVIVLRNSMGGELDRKEGDDIGDLLRRYAEDGCLDYGDTLAILSEPQDD